MNYSLKQGVITGASALYEHKLILFNPNLIYLEMPKGTNPINYSNKYKITTQSLDTIYIGTLEKNNKKIYTPERLFIELERFPLENGIRMQALNNLEKIINPFLVEKIYLKIKKKRRKLNNERIEKFIISKKLNVVEQLDNKKNLDKTTIIREYLLALLSNKDIPTLLIKGGSAIELFINFKRATEDIDAHADFQNLQKIIHFLSDEKNDIYFVVEDEKSINEQILKNKKIISFNLKPKSRKKIKEVLDNVNPINLTLNTTYNDDEIKKIIKEYNVVKKPLKNIKNGYSFVFTQEMLCAEKFQSLISKPSQSTRTKDLIDLYILYDEKNINFDKFVSWLLKKWKNNRYSKDKKEIIELLEQNKNMDLLKIKMNFDDAKKMYDIKENWTYKDSFNKYQNIALKVIEYLKKI